MPVMRRTDIDNLSTSTKEKSNHIVTLLSVLFDQASTFLKDSRTFFNELGTPRPNRLLIKVNEPTLLTSQYQNIRYK